MRACLSPVLIDGIMGKHVLFQNNLLQGKTSGCVSAQMGINNVGNDAPVCVLTYLPGGC